ncbi:MAG TPA: capsule biosynthesis protein, partial [Novosphingobium sp.]|nr:capsule biosynthesis protein [Novosphingobium sp.]
ELTTRFGRENIGFLWVMAEPLLFATLVGLLWRIMHGVSEHGINVFAFVATGYLPMVLFRNAVNRSVGLFQANASLMYHRQILIQDFVLVRFCVECIGHMMAYLFIGVVMVALGLFPMPYDLALMLAGWAVYGWFTLAMCCLLAPLSELSPVLEKVMPVSVYLMVPFSGAFTMAAWLAPGARALLLCSPPVHGMEMMRAGLFGPAHQAYYALFYPLAVSGAIMAVGLWLCRQVRRHLVVEA